ncbi:aminoglycoside phosphotransferase family protein [Nocardiopsis tropica]|uniref:Aminoglycoside phosphotransferase family protein n=1 Tax=Nocardiopsis tropica TaxID=109330 RepID=A0ABU7KN05_9ACTN|nr:aminoglycoside phosphotransferase family protein [Nocardiopsis umidischolae]MEE2050659.1 aminoglycoside phosphotransferase family protein [Nocardiopsis umidischolae]
MNPALVTRLADAGIIAPHHEPRPHERGPHSHVFTATAPDGTPLAVKVYRPERPNRVATAAWAAQHLTGLGVPAPRVLFHDSQVCVQTWMSGIALPLLPPQIQMDATRDAAQQLRRTHSLPMAGYGRLNENGIGIHPTWRSWLLALPAGPTLHPVRSVLAEASLRVDDDVHPHLLHGDWTARHVLCTGATVTGIVDLDSARAGDPMCDIAGWSLQEPAPLARALAEGYFRTPPDLSTRLRLVLQRIRISASLLGWHLDRGDTALARLRRDQLHADLDDLAAGTLRTLPRVSPHPH